MIKYILQAGSLLVCISLDIDGIYLKLIVTDIFHWTLQIEDITTKVNYLTNCNHKRDQHYWKNRWEVSRID